VFCLQPGFSIYLERRQELLPQAGRGTFISGGATPTLTSKQTEVEFTNKLRSVVIYLMTGLAIANMTTSQGHYEGRLWLWPEHNLFITVLWRACNLTAFIHSSTGPVVDPFASRHEGPGFNPQGGTCVKPGFSC
jgi:hypothetical protein